MIHLSKIAMAVRKIWIFPIRVYQYLISPLLPPACRYYPTCSAYAAEAIMRFGFWRGCYLAIKRLCRCHPWGGSGYDPVPKRIPPKGNLRSNGFHAGK